MFNFTVSLKTTTTPLLVKMSKSEVINSAVCDVRNYRNVAVFILSWMSLLTDSPSGYKPRGVLNRHLKECLTGPIVDTVNRMAILADRLVNNVYMDDVLGTTTGPFILEMLDTPVSMEYIQFTKTLDMNIFKYILTFLTHGKKLYYEDSSFDVTALRRWQSVEERISQVPDDPKLYGLLREIIGQVTKGYEEFPFQPHHGSGSVSQPGVFGVKMKNDLMNPDLKVSELVNMMHVGGFDQTIPLFDHRNDVVPPLSHSRVKFVAKDLRTSRSIGMEPPEYMWAQQGVRHILENCISKSFLCKHVFINDQTENREAACYGSISSRLDTIDLSDASDSARWSCVKEIFTKDFSYMLHLTRTEQTLLPTGELVELKKFAPMGSALCFPVQCVIYSSVVTLASLIWWYELKGLDLELLYLLKGEEMVRLFESISNWKLSDNHSKLEPFKVYGDDIVCDNRITSIVIGLLQHLGFKVNEEKSFMGDSAFRESCGGFYLDGSDVTPFKIKLNKFDDKLSVKTLAGVIDSANRAYEYGYLNTRQLFVRIALYYPIEGSYIRGWDPKTKNYILFSGDPDDALALYSINANNKHLVKRVNSPLQREELSSLTSVPAEKEEISEDIYFYRAWTRSKPLSGKTDFVLPAFEKVVDGPKITKVKNRPKNLIKRFDSKGNRVALRWTPA